MMENATELNYKQKQNKKMEQTNITLQGTLDGKGIDKDALYFIDFSKMTRIEDLILILASIGFSFSPAHPHWDAIKQFMDTENPFYPNNPPQQHEIKLPKLKKVDGAK